MAAKAVLLLLLCLAAAPASAGTLVRIDRVPHSLQPELGDDETLVVDAAPSSDPFPVVAGGASAIRSRIPEEAP